jgi:hypothetical protein
MATRLQLATPEKEDFFTRLSFSALIGEFSDKENIMRNDMELPRGGHGSSPTVRLARDAERWLALRSEQELINIVLM